MRVWIVSTTSGVILGVFDHQAPATELSTRVNETSASATVICREVWTGTTPPGAVPAT